MPPSHQPSPAFLPADTWAGIVRHAPLVSIDLIVENAAGAILLGERVNRPAQGYWFTPGGVIRKGERLDDAFTRLTRDELGIELQRASAPFYGLYEHHYDDNFSGTDFGTHYVVLAHHIRLDNLPSLPKDQHKTYTWMSRTELLAHERVHRYVKDYLREQC